jgi:predicted RNase H-like HicB family nuclease
MNPNKYQMVIYWSDEDRAYLVEIPELPGCMANCKTRQAALANAETNIKEWMETADDLGRSVPTPQGHLLTISKTAERLGLSIAMVHCYCADGKLPAQKIGHYRAILQRDVEHFAATPRHSGRPSLHYVTSLQSAHHVADK